MDEHFCNVHNTKFYRNEKNGRVWYSHRVADTGEFCNEAKQTTNTPKKSNELQSNSMLICNAMNNAVALAASGRIELDQIKSYFRIILEELEQPGGDKF